MTKKLIFDTPYSSQTSRAGKAGPVTQEEQVFNSWQELKRMQNADIRIKGKDSARGVITVLTHFLTFIFIRNTKLYMYHRLIFITSKPIIVSTTSLFVTWILRS